MGGFEIVRDLLGGDYLLFFVIISYGVLKVSVLSGDFYVKYIGVGVM